MGLFRRNTGGSAAAGSSSSSAPVSPRGLGRKSTERANAPAMCRTSTAGTVGSETTAENRLRRRSSTFSQYSFSEAQQDFQEETLDPGPNPKSTSRRWKSWLPVMFALVPPFAGLIFKNGTAFFSDLILLCLASIFLHWSVTGPWRWYDAAQQVREDQEGALEESFDSPKGKAPAKSDSESESWRDTPQAAEARQERARQLERALIRLRIFEVLALGACFIAPAIATYFLYSVRYLLSRRSEGVIANVNIGIFLLAAEVTPLSHSIKLILAHTLHLQRIVHSNPYRTVRMTPSRYRALLARVKELEEQMLELAERKPCEGCDCGDAQKQQAQARQMREQVTRDVRAAVGPDIDSVIRAVRRYEKKTSTLTSETDQRLAELRRSLDDVIALSAVVARKKAEGWGILGKLAGGGWFVATLPVTATVATTSTVMSPVLRGAKWLAREGKQWLDELDDAHEGGDRDGRHQQRNDQVRDQPVKQRPVAGGSSLVPRSGTPTLRYA
ncbi:hypothetical protein MYCTH_2303653 [Thermothelomyces thermophilus ATCC 42464]|uniref:Uncharacterized protein n=1 Tax=Thermothelomyces thermophilus (strain ATCC 42464 / BCRC 31852 / DSM 1799) TaxID=573729 RepID=G2QD90_THET4|nr:uncharacterized protein MYCTH_2303653 [Thermothelomyces thermophilus ATCC 42464]AEO57456.1 hypothetical protein MYCTH_2303653 [Thermothelomyces thermophilus ATCC 42464]